MSNEGARSVVHPPEICLQAVHQGYVLGKLTYHTLTICSFSFPAKQHSRISQTHLYRECVCRTAPATPDLLILPNVILSINHYMPGP